jgi:hypothetical protein
MQSWTDDCFASDHQGLTDLQNIENNLQCLKTAFSGDSAPSSPSAGQWWYDTLNDILKIRNEANSAWIEVYDFGNDRVASGKVKTASLADGILSADTTGRAKMADGFITTAKIGDGQVSGVKLENSSIGSSKLASAAVTGAKLQNVVSGSGILMAYADTLRTANYSSYTKSKEILCNRTGTVTVYFELKSGTYGPVYGRIYINSVGVGTVRSTYDSENFTGWSESISVTAGDYIQLYTYTASPGYSYSYQNFRIFIGVDGTNASITQD